MPPETGKKEVKNAFRSILKLVQTGNRIEKEEVTDSLALNILEE